MPEVQISVFLVDDHTLVRRGFRRLLEDDPGIRVVGEAGDGHEALTAVAALNGRDRCHFSPVWPAFSRQAFMERN